MGRLNHGLGNGGECRHLANDSREIMGAEQEGAHAMVAYSVPRAFNLEANIFGSQLKCPNFLTDLQDKVFNLLVSLQV